MKSPQVSRIITCVALLPVITQAQEFGEKADEFADFLEALGDLKLYLGILFVVTVAVHVYYYPQYATRQLMKQYKSRKVSLEGHVKSCVACEQQQSADVRHHIVEIMYEAPEHRYADNPSMKFRFPAAVDRKHFSIKVQYARQVRVDEKVEIWLSDRNWPRTGYPKELVESSLQQEEQNEIHKRCGLWMGMALDLVVLAHAVQHVQNSDLAASKVALGVGVCVIESCAILLAVDTFLKFKRTYFDSAKRVFVAETEMQSLIQETRNSISNSSFNSNT